MLVERRTGRTDTFAFSGTMGGYHWATWLDSTRFVIAGWGEADLNSGARYGTLDLFDLARGVTASYFAPAVAAEAYARYEDAWKEWVAKRYRAAYGTRSRPS